MAKKYNNYAFIDSQNLNLGVQGLGWQLDFAKFRVYLRHRFRVKKAFLFIGYIKANEKLYAFLKKSGYELIFKDISMAGGQIKGNVDAELVLHAAAIEYDNYDRAIIVTGDGDFFCLLEYLQDNQKLERLIVPNINGCSKLLKQKRFKGYRTYLSSKGFREKLHR